MKLSELNKRLKLAVKQNKAYTTLLGASVTTPLLLALYGWHPGVTVNAVTSGLVGLNSTIIAQITKMSFGYQKAITDNTTILNEAVKVATAQESIATTQIAKADKNARQLSVDYKAAVQASNDIMDAKLKFGGQTGQGYSPCLVLAKNTQLDKGMSAANAEALAKVDELDNAPGAVADSALTALQRRDEHHKNNFCTPEEKEAGKCSTVSSMPGSDSNAATLFVSSKPGSLMSEAKIATRQNILGSPVLSLPAAGGQSIAGQAYLAAVNHKTALSAFPALTLAKLDAMSQVRDDLKDEKGNPQSANDMLFNAVGRYYGGPEAAEWNKSMIQQQPRGMLVELAKIEGLGAWMDYHEYEDYQLMAGNIAALTLTSALPMEESLRRQAQRMNNRNVNNNIPLN